VKPKAIIPFKKERAKSRLGGVLSEKEREEFAVRMLGDVLVALSESEELRVGVGVKAELKLKAECQRGRARAERSVK
jgi:2-phospho-L-lactate guanylyltransferase (CobY/MobA/RfbA family)